jgi:hypothetical protein
MANLVGSWKCFNAKQQSMGKGVWIMAMKLMDLFGGAKKDVVPVTLQSFLSEKDEVDKEEVDFVISNSAGDFKILGNEPQYSNGSYPECRTLSVMYNGREFELQGRVSDGKLCMASPIQALHLWAKGKENQYMVGYKPEEQQLRKLTLF